MIWYRYPAALDRDAALHYGYPGRTARYRLVQLGPMWRISVDADEVDHVTDDLGAWCRARRIPEPEAADVAWVRGGA